MADWVRKSEGSAHAIVAVLQDANGPVDLPLGTVVTMRAKLRGETTAKINAAANVVAPGAAVGHPDRGKVRYGLTPADVAPPYGFYEVDWLANIPGLGEQHFPENGYMTLLLLPGADDI